MVIWQNFYACFKSKNMCPENVEFVTILDLENWYYYKVDLLGRKVWFMIKENIFWVLEKILKKNMCLWTPSPYFSLLQLMNYFINLFFQVFNRWIDFIFSFSYSCSIVVDLLNSIRNHSFLFIISWGTIWFSLL